MVVINLTLGNTVIFFCRRRQGDMNIKKVGIDVILYFAITLYNSVFI